MEYSEVAVDRVSTTESQTLKTGSGPKMTVLDRVTRVLLWLGWLAGTGPHTPNFLNKKSMNKK